MILQFLTVYVSPPVQQHYQPGTTLSFSFSLYMFLPLFSNITSLEQHCPSVSHCICFSLCSATLPAWNNIVLQFLTVYVSPSVQQHYQPGTTLSFSFSLYMFLPLFSNITSLEQRCPLVSHCICFSLCSATLPAWNNIVLQFLIVYVSPPVQQHYQPGTTVSFGFSTHMFLLLFSNISTQELHRPSVPQCICFSYYSATLPTRNNIVL